MRGEGAGIIVHSFTLFSDPADVMKKYIYMYVCIFSFFIPPIPSYVAAENRLLYTFPSLNIQQTTMYSLASRETVTNNIVAPNSMCQFREPIYDWKLNGLLTSQ